MLRRFGLVFALLLSTGCSTLDSRNPEVSASTSATRVIAASKTATGGKAWDKLEGSYEEGKHGQTPFKTWFDFRQFGTRTESIGPDGAMAMGFDGKVAWQNRGGQVRTIGEGPIFTEAMMTAFVSNNGFYFPDRFASTTRYLRAAKYADNEYNVIEVVPNGGRPIELWFDSKSHHLGRLVDAKGPQPVILELSDYKKVGDVLIAHQARVTDLSGRLLEAGKVAFVEHKKISREMFGPNKSAN